VALDRYRGIKWPLKAGYSKFRAKMLVSCIWVVSIAEAIPNLLAFHVRKGERGQESGPNIDFKNHFLTPPSTPPLKTLLKLLLKNLL
jgi:hypothetical protein